MGACSDRGISGYPWTCAEAMQFLQGRGQSCDSYQGLLNDCQASCGKCSQVSTQAMECKDEDTNCASYVPYCNDPQYKHWLSQKCEASCGLCSSNTGGNNGGQGNQ